MECKKHVFKCLQYRAKYFPIKGKKRTGAWDYAGLCNRNSEAYLVKHLWKNEKIKSCVRQALQFI